LSWREKVRLTFVRGGERRAEKKPSESDLFGAPSQPEKRVYAGGLIGGKKGRALISYIEVRVPSRREKRGTHFAEVRRGELQTSGKKEGGERRRILILLPPSKKVLFEGGGKKTYIFCQNISKERKRKVTRMPFQTEKKGRGEGKKGCSL